MEFPRLTRENIIRQQIQKTLEASNYGDAVETAKSYTDATSIDNIKKVQKPVEDQTVIALKP